MTAYEKTGELSIFKPDKDENVLVVNNHTSFHESM